MSSLNSNNVAMGFDSSCQMLAEPSYGADLNVLKVNSSDHRETDYHLKRDEHQVFGAEISAKLEKGFSMQFNFIQCRHPMVAKMADQLVEFTGGLSVNVNAYLTPSGSCKAFPPHYDPWDVFILQIQGQKKWSLFRSFITLPHPHQVAKLKHLTTMDTPWKGENPVKIRELVMHPGDLLYIPRGVIHAAESSVASDGSGEDPSLHLSFGANIAMSSDLLLIWETVLHFSLQETSALIHGNSRSGEGGRSDNGDSKASSNIDGYSSYSPLQCPLPPHSIFMSVIEDVFKNAVAMRPHKQEESMPFTLPTPTWRSLLHLLVYAAASEEGLDETKYLLRRGVLPQAVFAILPSLFRDSFSNLTAARIALAESADLVNIFHEAVKSVMHFAHDNNMDSMRNKLWGAARQAETHPRRRAYEGNRNFFFDRWMTSSSVVLSTALDPFECLYPGFHFDDTTPFHVMLQAMVGYWAGRANLVAALYPFRDEYRAQKQKAERWRDTHLRVHKERHEEFQRNPDLQLSNTVCAT